MAMLDGIIGAGVGALATIGVALAGLEAWRRELLGRRRIELAEETLTLFYEARDALAWVRGCSRWFEEEPELVRKPGESDDQLDARRRSTMIINRFIPYGETFSKIRALRYRFMAQIGKEAAKPFDDLAVIVDEVQFSARWLARTWAEQLPPGSLGYARHRVEVIRNETKIGWGRYHNEEDPIAPRIDALMAELEDTCRRVIERSGGLTQIRQRRPNPWNR